MLGNVICLPKSGSTYVADLLGSIAIHEYDHERISLLTVEADPAAQQVMAAFYLDSRRDELSERIDVCTSKIFLLSSMSKEEYILPTLFLFRDPLYWCRSILSYSVSVAQTGGYHQWVSRFQTRFCGDYPLTFDDINCEHSLAQNVSALLPRLIHIWYAAYTDVFSRLSSFPNYLLLTTSSLSASHSDIRAHFSISSTGKDLKPDVRMNRSMQLALVADICDKYFRSCPPFPEVVSVDSLPTYLDAFCNWCNTSSLVLQPLPSLM